MIYLDNNATTAISTAVAAAVRSCLKERVTLPRYGRKLLDSTADAVRQLLGVTGGRVIFTSGGTENAAVAFATALYRSGHTSAVCSLADHISVLNQHSAVANKLSEDVAILPIMPDGQPDSALFNQYVTAGTALLTLNLVNSETGVICTDIPDMVSAAKHKSKALIFLDACQAVGRLDLTGIPEDVDMVSISAHKFHGPRGVGALWVREGAEVYPAWGGGFQQDGLRSGTDNTIGIVGMRAALLESIEKLDKNFGHMAKLQVLLDRSMLRIQDVTINFGDCARVCNTSSYLVKGVHTKVLSILLRHRGIIVSDTTSGLSQTSAISPLMTFLHSEENGYSNLRLSLCRDTKKKEVETATAEIAQAIKALRKLFPRPFPGVKHG